MPQMQNPFTTLYVTERMDGDKFPSLFSPVLVSQALSLFQAGNVVVRGTQGTGKSMLLALLRTDTRLAFHERTDVSYPVPDDLCKFVSTTINLSSNQALRFATRWSKSASTEDLLELRSGFVDYINTWLLRDLLQSIRTLQRSQTGMWQRLGLGVDGASIEEGILEFAKRETAGNLFQQPKTFDEAIAQLTRRIDLYLRFLNGKVRELPDAIRLEQQDSVGQPLMALVNTLRETGCLAPDTRVIAVIDQFEQLLDFETQIKDRNYGLLRNVIDEAIHLREPTICYRVGTRPYAWKDRRSESLRDYMVINLDDMLRRKEHPSSQLFPALAVDVFLRRLRCFGYADEAKPGCPLQAVLGVSPKPNQRVSRIVSRAKPNWAKILKIPKGVTEPVQKALTDLARSNPMSAKLGVAWIRQQIASDGPLPLATCDLIESNVFPWDCDDRKWWRKERRGLAVLQMAAAHGQRVPMFGKKDILDLSGGNILVFGSICQHIWACWLRSRNGVSPGDDGLPIDPAMQDEGVRNASREWHDKISEEAWLGDSLTHFIDEFGNYLHTSLIADEQMSYPGGNGISLSNKDLMTMPEVARILSDGADRGFLLQRRHTSKTRTRGPSTKWYTHPILAPFYELTVAHTKEPLYVRAMKVRRWMDESAGTPPADGPASSSPDDERQRFLPYKDSL